MISLAQAVAQIGADTVATAHSSLIQFSSASTGGNIYNFGMYKKVFNISHFFGKVYILYRNYANPACNIVWEEIGREKNTFQGSV